jgi:hypothetical protein
MRDTIRALTCFLCLLAWVICGLAAAPLALAFSALLERLHQKRIGAWCLVLLWCLALGAWSFSRREVFHA